MRCAWRSMAVWRRSSASFGCSGRAPGGSGGPAFPCDGRLPASLSSAPTSRSRCSPRARASRAIRRVSAKMTANDGDRGKEREGADRQSVTFPARHLVGGNRGLEGGALRRRNQRKMAGNLVHCLRVAEPDRQAGASCDDRRDKAGDDKVEHRRSGATGSGGLAGGVGDLCPERPRRGWFAQSHSGRIPRLKHAAFQPAADI